MKNSWPGAILCIKILSASAPRSPFRPLRRQARPPRQAVAGTAVIPRSALFGNPEKTQARVSPDGKYVSFIAPKDGVLNVWVGPRSELRRQAGDQRYQARHPPAFLGLRQQTRVYIQDEGGDENWHLYATTWSPVRPRTSRLIKVSRRRSRPLVEEARFVAVGLNDRVPEYHDLWEVNLTTGKRVLIEQNTQEFAGYDLDFDLKPSSR